VTNLDRPIQYQQCHFQNGMYLTCFKNICLFKIGFFLLSLRWASIGFCNHAKFCNQKKGWCFEVVWLGFHLRCNQCYLNIEQFLQRKFNKIKTKHFRESGESFWYYWKTLNEWDFLEAILSLLDPKCKRYRILNSFFHWKLIQNSKYFFTIELYHQGLVYARSNYIVCSHMG
jgi:hypothetical protein